MLKKIMAVSVSLLMMSSLHFTVSAEIIMPERSDLNYSQMIYQEFDNSKLNKAAEKLINISENNVPGKESEIEKLVNTMLDEYDLQSTMYNIRYNQFYTDVTNSDLENEINLLWENYNKSWYTIYEALNALYYSDYSNFMYEILDEGVIMNAAYYNGMNDSEMEIAEKLSSEESKLILEYEKASSQDYAVTYNGKTWTISEFSENPPINGDEYDAVSEMIYDKRNNELGEIFLELVKVRNEIADFYGYSSYVDYAYQSTYIRDYSPDDVINLYDVVKDRISLLSEALYEKYFDSAYSSDLLYKTYSDEDVMNAIAPYFGEIDSEFGDNFSHLKSHGLYDIEQSDSKIDSGYTTTLYSYGVPFIYNNGYGDFQDFQTMIHEFGHANAIYENPTRSLYDDNGTCMDTMEIHSQGMEVLFTEYHDDIFGEQDGETFSYGTLWMMTSAIIDGCLYDEFQRFAYETPNCTLEQLNEKYEELCYEYSVNYSKDINYAYDWTEISHNFNAPFYYISYATSALTSLDLWIEAQDNREYAIEKYKDIVDCGFYTPYVEAIEKCDLRNIFEPGTISDIAEDMAILTGVYDDIYDDIYANEPEDFLQDEETVVTENESSYNSESEITDSDNEDTESLKIMIMIYGCMFAALIIVGIILVVILIITAIIYNSRKKNNKK